MTTHNPDNVTPAQVGNGWRLLAHDELVDYSKAVIELWFPTSKVWHSVDAATYRYSYRTNLTREQLRQHKQ